MKTQIQLTRDDITRMNVDAIVNAARPSLLGGGGVDGAIHRAAGPELLAECRTLGGCETGDAKISRGYNLPAKWVVHTVGPIWRPNQRATQSGQLASCYTKSLQLAAQHCARTIAFPAISCGAYGYPVEEAAPIAVGAVRRFAAVPSPIETIWLCCFTDEIWNAYSEMLNAE